MRDEGEAQDVGYERKREGMTPSDYRNRGDFLDGKPAKAVMFNRSRGMDEVPGRFNKDKEVFISLRDDGSWLTYYTTTLPCGFSEYFVIVGTDGILGEVKLTEKESDNGR